MKRILFACFLLTATCAAPFIQTASAQTMAVTASAFTTQVNLMDTQLAAGDVTSATATWETINGMMKAELGITKGQIASATPDAATATAKYHNQVTMYKAIWALKSSLATNRTALHTQLVAFGATI